VALCSNFDNWKEANAYWDFSLSQGMGPWQDYFFSDSDDIDY
jgi:hypothetical protein